jgi:hypothetical protein
MLEGLSTDIGQVSCATCKSITPESTICQCCSLNLSKWCTPHMKYTLQVAHPTNSTPQRTAQHTLNTAHFKHLEHKTQGSNTFLSCSYMCATAHTHTPALEPGGIAAAAAAHVLRLVPPPHTAAAHGQQQTPVISEYIFD